MPMFDDPLKQKYQIDCSNLFKIFKHFKLITKCRYGREGQNLKGIEEELKEVRKNPEVFSQEHLKIIEDKEKKYWDFRFPPFPSLNEHEISEIAKNIKNRNEREECITTMYNILYRNIRHVSLILRFVDPENFALFSPHSIIILGTKRTGDIVDTYVNYLKDLKEIKEKSNGEFSRIADIDHALFLLSILDENPDLETKTEPKIPVSKEIYNMKDDLLGRIDSLIMTIKAKNLLGGIWEKERLVLAKMLFNVDKCTAGLLAGHILSTDVPKIGNHLGIDHKEYRGEGAFLNLFKEICKREQRFCKLRVDIEYAWREIRNKIVHEGCEIVTQEKVQKLIDTAEEISNEFKQLSP